MPPLIDPDIRRRYEQALEHWQFAGDVRFGGVAQDWLRRHGYTQREIAEAMHLHVHSGATIDQVEETREEWRDSWDYHYDLRLEVRNRRLYIETRVVDERPDDPRIFVVNVHDV
jgi:hypothetical protein